MIDGAVGVVDPEVDAEFAGADLLEDLLDVAGQGSRPDGPTPRNVRPAWRAIRRGSKRSANIFFM